jgi:hypothetical protein
MKAVKRLLCIVLLLFVLPVATLWWAVSQPTFSRRAPSAAIVDAGLLRRHVVALSETFCPRSFYDTNNL